MPSAGKHVTDAKREEIHNQCQARENVYSAKRAGTFNHIKKGKTFRYQARENMSQVSSAGKWVTSDLTREICKLFQVQQNR